MNFNTRPNIDNRSLRQLTGDSITLSGLTNFFGVLQSKGVEIDATITSGITAGFVLRYDGTKIKLQQDSSGRGNAIIDDIVQTSHGFIVGDVIGFNSVTSKYDKSTASGASSFETLGIVSDVYNVNSFEITYQGFVSGITSTVYSPLISGATYFLSPNPLSAGTLTVTETTTVGQVSKPLLVALNSTSGLFVNWRGNVIVTGSTSGGGGSSLYPAIGIPTDGSYTDGLLPLISGDTIANTVDQFNQLFALFAPQPAPNLNNIGKTGTGNFVSANLSFGTSNNNAAYTLVTNAAGNGAVDINGSYLVTGTRLGVMNGSNITGILNDSVVGNTGFPADSFGNAEKGSLKMYLNNILIDTLILSGTTGASSTTRMSVSALGNVLTANGSPFTFFKYRTGTYIIPNTFFLNGFNYLRIIHDKGTSTSVTNYLEFVYDPDSTSIAFVGTPTIQNPVLSGNKYISGVHYHTAGTVDYTATLNNLYRTVYSVSTGAFAYPSRVNIGDATSIVKTGAGITSQTNAIKNVPALNPAASNPATTSLTLVSTHPINVQRLLGSLPIVGRVENNITMTHPLKTTLTGGASTLSGFLIDSTTQVSNQSNEDFDGELLRMQNRSYLVDTFVVANAATYLWDSTLSLVGANPTHNNGLLLFNSELMYPSTSYLTTQFGITNGNFGAITLGYAGNPNYSIALGVRDYNRRFTSTNPITQSSLTIDIIHTGSNSDFLIDGGTGGSPSGNAIKLECLIKRSVGSTHGYFNPFASIGNPEGIANTSIQAIAGGTRVVCTLSTVPRIAQGDIVFVVIKASAGWVNRIQNIQVVNII